MKSQEIETISLHSSDLFGCLNEPVAILFYTVVMGLSHSRGQGQSGRPAPRAVSASRSISALPSL